jgi:hypothetical protein
MWWFLYIFITCISYLLQLLSIRDQPGLPTCIAVISTNLQFRFCASMTILIILHVWSSRGTRGVEVKGNMHAHMPGRVKSAVMRSHVWANHVPDRGYLYLYGTYTLHVEDIASSVAPSRVVPQCCPDQVRFVDISWHFCVLDCCDLCFHEYLCQWIGTNTDAALSCHC